jgi:membrane dipeptidase
MENALDEIEANLGRCKLAKTVTDIQAAFEEGGVAILLGTEGAHWLEGSVKPLRLFHRLGLRELQLTWDTPNELVPDGHLSGFGLNVISECARLGIIVDVTHIPQQAFYEVMEVSERPVIVSHGTACGVTEDLEDEQIQALAATGGLLGVHFYTTYLGPSPGPEDVVRQIEYIAEIAGIDHVALGADFFPTEGAWRDLQVAQGTTELEWAIPDMSEMPRITECMVERGFSALDVQKVLGKNFLRVCEQVFV